MHLTDARLNEIGAYAMPLQNRVTPYGDLVAVTGRGMWTGNRGVLHTPEKQIIHYNRGRRWITCQLEFRGWRRPVMEPNRWTQLFFLDEATAFAAGHRPCAMCRYSDYQRFRRTWAEAMSTALPSADEMDLRLHADRLAGPRTKRTNVADLGDLPSGAMIELDGEPWLVGDQQVLRWTPGGYDLSRPKPEEGQVVVITPACMVQVIAAGYSPSLHPSARDQITPPRSG